MVELSDLMRDLREKSPRYLEAGKVITNEIVTKCVNCGKDTYWEPELGDNPLCTGDS